MSLMTASEYQRLNELGEIAREEIRNAIRTSSNIPCQVTGAGSLLHLHLNNRQISDYRTYYRSADEVSLQAQFHRYLLNHGILIAPHGLAVLSTPMNQVEIDQLAETVLQALRAIWMEPAAPLDAIIT